MEFRGGTQGGGHGLQERGPENSRVGSSRWETEWEGEAVSGCFSPGSEIRAGPAFHPSAEPGEGSILGVDSGPAPAPHPRVTGLGCLGLEVFRTRKTGTCVVGAKHSWFLLLQLRVSAGFKPHTWDTDVSCCWAPGWSPFPGEFPGLLLGSWQLPSGFPAAPRPLPCRVWTHPPAARVWLEGRGWWGLDVARCV